MKVIRKMFNKYSDAERDIILRECEEMEKYAEEVSHKDYEEATEEAELYNNVCPKCGGKEIVKRMINKGYTVPGFFCSSTNITIEPINHCAKCGNEWEEYPTYLYAGGADEEIHGWASFLYEPKNFCLLPKIIMNYHAESIYEIIHKRYAGNIGEIDSPGLTYLRKHFKSVYE